MTKESEESGRLAEVYAALSLGELQQLAKDSSSLTHAARNLLMAELARRGGNAFEQESDSTKDPPGDSGQVDFRDPVTIRRFRDLPEALLAKGSLESAGIRCALADDNMVRLDWFISNLLGGVKLQVAPEDATAATEILDQPIPEEFDTEGTGDYRQPKCPNCQSLDVTFEELNKPIAYASAFIGFPLPIHRAAWKCHACGREWDDDAA
jgi:Putative prokaryotic signal transducing protein